MAHQRIWRDGIDEPPPEDWTFVTVSRDRMRDRLFVRPDPKYRNINWTDNVHIWLKTQHCEYACLFEPTGLTVILYAFSEPDVALHFKILWG